MQRIKMLLTEEEAAQIRQQRLERNRERAEEKEDSKPRCRYAYPNPYGTCLQKAKIEGYCGTHFNKLYHPEKLGRRKTSRPEQCFHRG